MKKIGYVYKQVDGTFGLSDVTEETLHYLYDGLVADLSELIPEIERGNKLAIDDAVSITKSIQNIKKAKDDDADA